MADDILEIIEVGLRLRLVERGLVDADESAHLVGEYIDEVRESYGGIRYMIKRGYKTFAPRKIAAMRREWNGRNAKQLQRKYGMSRSTFYRYIGK